MRSWQAVTICAAVGCGRLQFDERTDATPDGPPPIAIRTAGVWTTGTTDIRRTLGTATSKTTYTFASWFKSTSAGAVFFDAGITSSQHSELTVGLDAVPTADHLESGALYEAGPDYGGAQYPFANIWSHLVVSIDLTQALQEDRVRWWINGVPQSISTGGRMPFPQNLQLYLGDTISHSLGVKFDGGFHWEGSLAETYVIWDRALDMSAFIAMTPDGPRSIAYTGPVTPESLYFDYETPGQNLLPGQPDWTPRGITTSTTDLPY